MTTRISSLNLRYIKANKEDKQEISTVTIKIREIIKIDIDQIAEIGEYHSVVGYSMDRITETDQCIIKNYRGDYRRGNFRANLQSYQDYRGHNYRGGYRRNYGNDNYERGSRKSSDRHYSDNTRRNDRSSSRSTSGSRASTNRDRIRCYKYREYDHFAKDWPTLRVEKESEQMQQMYNKDNEQTILKLLATGTYDRLNRINSIDETTMDHLDL